MITYPDYYHNQNTKSLLINLSDEDRMIVNQVLSQEGIDLSVFIYNNENQIEWLLNTARLADNVYLNVDNSKDISYHYISYILSLPNVTWCSKNIDYSIINKDKVSNINEYIQKYWLA